MNLDPMASQQLPDIRAFSLLLCTGKFSEVRLFLRKRRAEVGCPVCTRSENALDGVGGLYVSGRWHTKGHPVVYCTLNPATALLEVLVHIEIDSEDRPEHFQVLRIEGPDALSIEEIEPDALPSNWAEDIASMQSVGDGWLSERRSLLLKVPRAFSLLVHTGQPTSARLFLKKRRTSLNLPVQSRSENALAYSSLRHGTYS